MKVWLDDVREPPDDSWTWAKSSNEAIALLKWRPVVEISLDHDLGLYDTGMRVAKHIVGMLARPIVHIHSMNPVGAKAMRDLLADRREKADGE